MGLTPDLLWLALSCVLCGGGNGRVLFICLLHPQYPHTLMEYEPAPFLVTSLVFLTSGLLPCFILDHPPHPPQTQP